MKNLFLLLTLLAAAALAQPGHLTDTRDNQTYKTVKIGSQTWMAQNLNYNAKESVCYDNKPENCQTFGRLYDWNTAIKACPKGWHLPSKEEWNILIKAVGGEDAAGKHLKAKSGWNDFKDESEEAKSVEVKSGNGLDSYGFSALPSGNRYLNGIFDGAGDFGLWWSASEDSEYDAYYRLMNSDYDYSYRSHFNKSFLFSVRCIKDN
jgi:uncharacterized protein (TIGR02145 family)